MASSSKRKSGSSARSTGRKKVVIGAGDTSRVRSVRPKPEPKGSRPVAAAGRRGDSAPRTAGDRAAAARRIQRERRLSRQRRVLQLRIALALVALVAVVAGGVSLYRSNVFAIERVDVVGNTRLSDADVTALADVPQGATLLRYPGDKIKERLESSPWISEASVARDFPDALRIRISEREPYALLDLGGEKLWMLDSTGYVIGEQTADVTSAVAVVRDVTGADPRPGTRTMSEPVLNAIAVWAGLSQQLRERTRAISAPSIDKTALITTDDIEILVGAAEDIDKKDLLARQILRDQKGKVVYISVRSIERPTWRGIDTP